MKKTIKYQFTVKDALIVLSKYKSKTPLTREMLDEMQKQAFAERIDQVRKSMERKSMERKK